ncbi:MAG TPA: HD domain-containing protein [Gemmatimonadales bacterium]|nr:HD domain-containing protein [Gemmatimonadales bacterium]
MRGARGKETPIAERQEPRSRIVRDLLWQNIRLEPAAVRVVDTPAFQRLRYVRQLGHAFLVYPGAAHARFEHALGTYHLAARALAGLRERGDLDGLGEDDALLVRLAALLHDIGHYPFSHALEEAKYPSHEALGAASLGQGPLAGAVAAAGVPGGAAAIGAVMTGASDHPLAGLVAGSIDLDKIDYLKRDALMCGVPYGEIDVDRLLACLTVVELGGRRRIGMLEKGLAALESLLFAKYQMYRNVYWHHAVRSATAMFKRLVSAAVRAGTIAPAALAAATDDVLLHELAARDRSGIAAALRERRLYKRALELLPGELGDAVPAWVWEGGEPLERAEDALARRAGLAPGELLIDFPHKTAMLGLDLPIARADGSVEPLTDRGWPGVMDLPRMAEDLVESARRLRVFVAGPATVTPAQLLETLAA